MNEKLRVLFKTILFYSPKFISRKISKIKNKREIKIATDRYKRIKISKQELEDKINSLNIDSDVMLHTSMMNVGRFQGGVKFVTETIINKVDISKHTLLVSALPFRGSFKNYLEEKPVFDVKRSPIAMGAINERIAEMPNAQRSIHPTHSVVAIGKNADKYVYEHHLDKTPFGPHSPYYKLLENRGKLLLLGAKLNNLTFVHIIEDMLGDTFPYKYYETKRYLIDCIDENGSVIKVETPCHNVRLGTRRNLNVFYGRLVEEKIIKPIPLGDSEIILLDAYKFTLFYLCQLEKGFSSYGKHKVTKELINKIEFIKSQLKQ